MPCRCVSSKYFLWDPDLAFLSLGVVSALREVEWARAAHAAGAAALRYSYLGYYIHSNQKMRCAAAAWLSGCLRALHGLGMGCLSKPRLARCALTCAACRARPRKL